MQAEFVSWVQQLPLTPNSERPSVFWIQTEKKTRAARIPSCWFNSPKPPQRRTATWFCYEYARVYQSRPAGPELRLNEKGTPHSSGEAYMSRRRRVVDVGYWILFRGFFSFLEKTIGYQFLQLGIIPITCLNGHGIALIFVYLLCANIVLISERLRQPFFTVENLEESTPGTEFVT